MPPETRKANRILSALAVFCVAAQFGGALLPSLLALGIWLGALAYFRPRVLRRLWLPRFWLLTLFFGLSCGLLLGPRDLQWLGLPLSRAGLASGLLMVVRGVFVFALVTWASQSLSGPGLCRLAGKIGAARLAAAVSVALHLLPELQRRLMMGRRGRLYRRGLGLIVQTAKLAEEMAGERVIVAAVVGPRDSGKTATLHEVSARLLAAGFAVGGISQPKIIEQGRRQGYLLRDEANGQQHAFAQRGTGGFSFAEEAWQWAHERIVQARRSARVVVVDELGLVEASGGGHLRALSRPLADESAVFWLLGVREGCQDQIGHSIGPIDRTLAADAPAAEREEFLQWISNHPRLCGSAVFRVSP